LRANACRGVVLAARGHAFVSLPDSRQSRVTSWGRQRTFAKSRLPRSTWPTPRLLDPAAGGVATMPSTPALCLLVQIGGETDPATTRMGLPHELSDGLQDADDGFIM